MPEPASSSAAGAAAAWGVKSGLAAAFATTMVSIITVLVGFTVVPLRRGREMQDAAARLAAGLLCSFVLGPPLAFMCIARWPDLLHPWQVLLRGESEQWHYLAAAAPFIAATALVGFWVMAAIARWSAKRSGEVVDDLMDVLRGGKRR